MQKVRIDNNSNVEDEFNKYISNLWEKAKTTKTVKNVNNKAGETIKFIKRENKRRPLWKILGVFIILLSFAFGKNFLIYGVRAVFTFLLSMTVFPFMQAYNEQKKGERK